MSSGEIIVVDSHWCSWCGFSLLNRDTHIEEHLNINQLGAWLHLHKYEIRYDSEGSLKPVFLNYLLSCGSVVKSVVVDFCLHDIFVNKKQTEKDFIFVSDRVLMAWTFFGFFACCAWSSNMSACLFHLHPSNINFGQWLLLPVLVNISVRGYVSIQMYDSKEHLWGGTCYCCGQ